MLDLFVLIHGVQRSLRRPCSSLDICHDADRQASILQMCFDPGSVFLAAKTAALGKTKGARHANRDSLAMHKPCPIVIGDPLQRMAECMAKIEEGAVAFLIFVARDNRGLGLAACRDRMNRARRRPRKRRANALRAKRKNRASPISPYLTTSAYPARNSRNGNVSSVAMSASTSEGW